MRSHFVCYYAISTVYSRINLDNYDQINIYLLNMLIICLFAPSQELVCQHEKEVQEHQAFTEACNTCITWVRSARETLAMSSDTYGDRDTVQAKQDKVKVSLHSLGFDLIVMGIIFRGGGGGLY